MNYISRHLQVLLSTLGDLFRTPMPTFISTLVIGITIAIPMLVYVSISSAKTLANSWEIQPQINLYLEDSYKQKDIDAMLTDIGFINGVSSTRLIPKEEALKQFKISSGLDIELAELKENPLPNAIVVTPKTQFSNAEQMSILVDNILKIDGIKEHSVNMDWLKRFNSLLKFGFSFSLLLACLLAIAVLLVISNTVGLLIRDRRQEIIVTKLVGGTNTFIKLPFLYYGALLGFFGSVLGILIYFCAHLVLEAPLRELAQTYNSQFYLNTLSLKEVLVVLLIGLILGWLAAQFNVFRQIRKINPK